MTEIGAELAKELLVMVKQTKSFVLEQAPDVLQQLVKWKIAESMFTILCGFLLLAGAWRAYKYCKSRISNVCDESAFPVGLLGAGCMMIGCGTIYHNVHSLLQLYMAPKVFLIEYLSRLVT